MTTKRIPLQKRVRRSAEDARAAILDAAEKRLQDVGPAGIRLQDVAAEVGVSHPTVLHHFVSRDALVEAVIERRAGALQRDLLAALAEHAGKDGDPVRELLECVAQTFGPGGHARIVAWLSLAGRAVRKEEAAGFDAIAAATHEVRKARRRENRRPAPSYEDTYFVVMLAGLAMFGDAIAGPLLRGQTDAKESAATSTRFRAWLARVLHQHLENG